jgi:putative tricarboxylic transport membrane protein
MTISFEVIADLFFLVLALAYGLSALALPEAMFGDPWAPRIYPLIISGGMSVLSIVLLINEIRKQHTRKESKPVRFILNSDAKVVGFVVIMSILYSIAFDFLGFVISTFIFLEAVMIYISKGKKLLWPTVIASFLQ